MIKPLTEHQVAVGVETYFCELKALLHFVCRTHAETKVPLAQWREMEAWYEGFVADFCRAENIKHICALLRRRDQHYRRIVASRRKNSRAQSYQQG